VYFFIRQKYVLILTFEVVFSILTLVTTQINTTRVCAKIQRDNWFVHPETIFSPIRAKKTSGKKKLGQQENRPTEHGSFGKKD